MFETWLRCNVFRGIFSDEVGVQISPKQGDVFAFIVSRDAVQGDYDQPGKLRVKAYCRGDTLWAVLPTEDQTVIPINDADLVSV